MVSEGSLTNSLSPPWITHLGSVSCFSHICPMTSRKSLILSEALLSKVKCYGNLLKPHMKQLSMSGT